MICIYVYSISASMLICVSEQNAPEKLIFDTLNMNIWNVNMPMNTAKHKHFDQQIQTPEWDSCSS